jgi:DNA-binding MarR family transcriptional regulator
MITSLTVRSITHWSTHPGSDVGHPESPDLAAGVLDSRELLPALAALPGHVVWRAHARVALALARELPDGVDIHAYAALVALAASDEPRSQQELADQVSISRTTMARVAADLVARGMVERVRNPADRRSYALTRTAAGAEAAAAWRRHVDAVQERLLTSYDDDERAALLGLLRRVVEAEIAPDTPPALLASVGFLVSKAHATLHRTFLAHLEPQGLEPRLFGALTALASTGPVAQAELARRMGVSGARVVQIVDALEERGLVARRRDPDDRRTQLLHVQPGGAGVLDRVRTTVDLDRVPPLSAAETARLVVLLRRFVTAP